MDSARCVSGLAPEDDRFNPVDARKSLVVSGGLSSLGSTVGSGPVAPMPNDSHAGGPAGGAGASSSPVGSLFTATATATARPPSATASSSLSRLTPTNPELMGGGRRSARSRSCVCSPISLPPTNPRDMSMSVSPTPPWPTAYVYLLGDQIDSSAVLVADNRAASPCNKTLRLSGVTLTSYASVGSRKSSTAHGYCAPVVCANCLYVSLSNLAALGRSTGRPLTKKNCLSPAPLPHPGAALDTIPTNTPPHPSPRSNCTSRID